MLPRSFASPSVNALARPFAAPRQRRRSRHCETSPDAGSQVNRAPIPSISNQSDSTKVSHYGHRQGGTATGLSGITVAVSPASFTVAPGASQEVEVTFTQATATLNAYSGGQITWTGDDGHVVRIPAVVKPVALAAPASVSGNGDPISYDVTFGYDGSFTASPRGLAEPVVDAGTVDQDPDQTFDPSDPTGTAAVPVTIPAGSTYKNRGPEYTFRGVRAFPSYLQAGPSFFIEKSKRRMIAEDIAAALRLIHNK